MPAIIDMDCFSFHLTMIAMTGEGGMMVTKDGRLAEKIEAMGLHGMDHMTGDGFPTMVIGTVRWFMPASSTT